MITLNKRLNKIPVKNVTGIDCWTTDGVMTATGVCRNTVSNWVNESRKGNLNLPFICKKKGCKVYFPIEKFLEWYWYNGQN